MTSSVLSHDSPSEQFIRGLEGALNAAGIPAEVDGDSAWATVPFPLLNGWSVWVYYDGTGFDYIERFSDPDGNYIDPWDWDEGCPWRQRIINWDPVDA